MGYIVDITITLEILSVQSCSARLPTSLKRTLMRPSGCTKDLQACRVHQQIRSMLITWRYSTRLTRRTRTQLEVGDWSTLTAVFDRHHLLGGKERDWAATAQPRRFESFTATWNRSNPVPSASASQSRQVSLCYQQGTDRANQILTGPHRQAEVKVLLERSQRGSAAFLQMFSKKSRHSLLDALLIVS